MCVCLCVNEPKIQYMYACVQALFFVVVIFFFFGYLHVGKKGSRNTTFLLLFFFPPRFSPFFPASFFLKK